MNLTTVTEISVGGVHACAHDKVHGWECWGGNVYGELGDGTGMSNDGPVSPLGIALP